LAVGEKAEVSDLDKACGQDMKKETSDKLDRLHSHAFLGVVVCRVPPAEGDLAFTHLNQASVGDSDAMGDEEAVMLKARSGLRWLGILAVAAHCLAREVPAPRDVDLKAADGTKLKATYFSAGKPGPGVLLLHQCDPKESKSRHNWDALAPRLAAAGINVLTFDYRGHGGSGGTFVYDQRPWLFVWPRDIDTAFAYLESQPGVKRDTIGAGGESCGGFLAIRLAQRHKEVRALVVMSTPQLSGSDRQFVRHANDMPMFIAVANDDIAPAAVMEWLYQLSPNPGSRFVRYEAGGHGVEMFTSHKELVGTIVDWFVQTLITTPGSAPAVAAGKPLPPAMMDIIDAPGASIRISAL
jgi:dienelactone hydrolase